MGLAAKTEASVMIKTSPEELLRNVKDAWFGILIKLNVAEVFLNPKIHQGNFFNV